MECTFEGTAQRVEIRGAGTTNMVRADAFSEGIAARVVLSTAQVGGLYPPVTIGALDELDPVDLDPSPDRPYKVTYALGEGAPDSRPVTIQIEAGAARTGRFKGPLDDAPECGAEAGCLISWQDAKHIALVVHPGPEANKAAGAGRPIRLTGWFPYVQSEEQSPRNEHLDEVTLEGATGTLVCDGERAEVSGRLQWAAGVDRSMHVRRPGIQWTPGGLRLSVTSSFAPAGAGATWPMGAVLGGAALALIGAITLLLVGRRARRRRATTAPVAPETALLDVRAPAPETPRLDVSAPTPETPLPARDIVLLAAEADAGLAAAIARHLTPLGEAVFNPHDPLCVPPGQDLLASTRRAIEQARVVTVVMSADLFDAPEPWRTLLDVAVKRRGAGTLMVVPVLGRVCAWEKTALGGATSLPRTGVFIESADNDAALAEVARGLWALLRPSDKDG